MKFRLHVWTGAVKDFSQAAQQYERERSGLGIEFLDEI